MEEKTPIKIDIISGFLGAGKTTFLKKLLTQAYAGESVALLENEFGEVAIDGEALRDSNIAMKEIANGCICCTLQGNFISAIQELSAEYHPQRIVIEPTGLGRLTDIFRACRRAAEETNVIINAVITIVDGVSVLEYLDDAPEFYENQIKQAGVIVVSMTQELEETTVEAISQGLRKLNVDAPLFTAPWWEIDAMEVLALAEERGCPEDDGSPSEKNPFRSLAFRVTKPWRERDLRRFFQMVAQDVFGKVYRGKGFFPTAQGALKVDLVGGRVSVEHFPHKVQGRFVLIGCDLDRKALAEFLRHGNVGEKE